MPHTPMMSDPLITSKLSLGYWRKSGSQGFFSGPAMSLGSRSGVSHLSGSSVSPTSLMLPESDGGSSPGHHSQNSLDHSVEAGEGDPTGDSPEHQPTGSRRSSQGGGRGGRDRTEAWWSVGEYLDTGTSVGLTHQNAKLTLTGNRVFANQKEEVWDLTDSLAELYQAVQRHEAAASSTLRPVPSESTTTSVISHQMSPDIDMRNINVTEWLSRDTNHGFIRVYPPDLSNFNYSQLIPVTDSTSVHRVCIMLGVSLNALHVQLNGDIIRRMDPYEHPLVLQNEYLTGLGYSDIHRIQREGTKEELGYLVRFYAGKPMFDSTYSRNQLQAFIEVRKGKMMHQWVRRLCVISGTRLLLYKDKAKKTRPSVVQLAKGGVEEVKFKGHEMCLKLTSTAQGERTIHLSFTNQQEYNKWYRKCKKATDKLPTSADLSNCHLEFLPENIFINEGLAMLNLRHNVLKERPLEEDIYTIGWLDDLPRFQWLRSLNLADNHMVSFPQALCGIHTLVELNIASNRLEEIPPEISRLSNLQALHVHNNHLKFLPDEMITLRKLFILVLAFNRFSSVPPVVAHMTDVRISEVDKIIMAGNQIENIPSETLTRMKYAKKVDFRLNQLTLPPTETTKFTALEHLTHLDIRDNFVSELDVRAIKTLEYLNCERNGMHTLQLNGMALKNLFVGHNCIEKFTVSPKPEWLLQIDLSHNQLRRLPDWLPDCFFLQKISANHNLLTELPHRLFTDSKKLKSLRVTHNRLAWLPAEVDSLFLEELLLQHNQLTQLPHTLLSKTNKLRVLNLTRNRLTTLPPLNENADLNKIQEIYLSGNNLGDSSVEVVSGYPRLKVLHMAHNEIYSIEEGDLAKLEMLQELNLAGNQLRALPVSCGQLTRLVVLRAHSNCLQSLPDFKNAKSLRVLDVGHNQLLNVSVTNLMASQLNLLDMSLNAQLKVNPKEFKHIKNRKSICLVDLTGQGRSLPGLRHTRTKPLAQDDELDSSLPWKVGFSESSGMRNKLCIATLKTVKFRSANEALFGMFDGGYNNEVPKMLLEKIPGIIEEELAADQTTQDYLKYSMLNAHRRLKAAGQKLGASAAVLHLQRIASNNKVNQYTLQLANVGDVEAVLCRRGEALPLTRKFVTVEDREECDRVYNSNGIITEDSKVSGTTRNTRLLGCAYLYPHVIPDPYVNNIDLRHDDEFIILANRSLWKYVSYEEAVEEIYETGNPVVAAKKLQDFAQGYGAKENISILVIRLNTDSGPSLGKLRPANRSMSIDDIEAAAKIEAKKKSSKMGDVYGRLHASTGKLMTEGNVTESKVKPRITVQSSDEEKENKVEMVERNVYVENNIAIDGNMKGARRASPTVTSRIGSHSPVRSPVRSPAKSPEVTPTTSPPSTPSRSSQEIGQSAGELKPLPNQRFRKKNAAVEWEGLLQKRLSGEVKDLEMKQLSSSVSSESIFAGAEVPLVTVDIDINKSSQYVDSGKKSKIFEGVRETPEDKAPAWTTRNNITQPWVDDENFRNRANPVYSLTKEPDETDIIHMTEKTKRPKVRAAIAMFENLERESRVPSDLQSSRSPTRSDLSPLRQANGHTDTAVVRRATPPKVIPRKPAKPTIHPKPTSHTSYSKPVVIHAPVETNNNIVPQSNVQALHGSIEAELYAKVRKIPRMEDSVQPATNTDFQQEELINDNGEIRVVEIARL